MSMIFTDFVKYSHEHQKIDLSLFEDMIAYIFSGEALENEILTFLLITNFCPLEKAHYLKAISFLRSKMYKIHAPSNAVDCCGTGGDSEKSGGSLNISTAVAFFAATAGLSVAKHGNRSISSRSGSADVLEAIGYPILEKPDEVEAMLKKTNLCFMFAPYFHPTLKYVATARRFLKVKSFFNLLGPLLNPAEVKHQLIGIYDKNLASLIAEILRELGSQRVMIVQSSEGSDELTLSGDNYYCLLDNGIITEGKISANDYGLPIYESNAIKGGDVSYNATAMKNLFSGNGIAAYRDTVFLNAGALHYISGESKDILGGIHAIKDVNKVNINLFL